MEKKQIKKKLLLVAPILFGIALVLFLGTARVLGVFAKGEEKIITSSTLTEAIDISELSTSQFTYNGIAEIYKDEKKEKVKCYIRYNAKVKAGIDMKDVVFEIDEESKTVKPILPEIKINSNPVVDENAWSFIPSDTTIELDDILAACEEDAIQEANESQKLFESAEENLKSIIEALLYPIIDSQGYSIDWD